MTVTDISPTNDSTDMSDRADCFTVAAEAVDLAAFLAGPTGEDWRDRAACRDIESDVFFPEKGANATAARLICSGCGVRAECLAYALSANERHGMWGGLTDRQRRPLRRRVPGAGTPFAQNRHTREQGRAA